MKCHPIYQSKQPIQLLNENKKTAKKVFEAYEKNDLCILNNIVDPKYTFHFPGQTIPLNFEEAKKQITVTQEEISYYREYYGSLASQCFSPIKAQRSGAIPHRKAFMLRHLPAFGEFRKSVEKVLR